jgi:hypothetical protein
LLLTTRNSYGQSRVNFTVDSSKIAILPCHRVNLDVFINCNSAELTSHDLQKIDSLLKMFVVEYNTEQTRQYDLFAPEAKPRHILLLLDLNMLKRQYVATINSSGEKVVWVNCFCDSRGKNWRKKIITSSGKRMCNFRISINLTTNKSFDFRLLPLKNSI